MSQDKFWEQWSAGGGQGEKKPEESAAPPQPGADNDALSAWLKSLPPNEDLLAPATPQQPSGASAAELAELWPPAAPVDPFTGIQKSAGPPSSSEWDLAFDPVPSASPAPAEPPPTPALPGTGLGDFQLGGAAAPAAPPVPAAGPAPAAPVPPAESPFGPPPPPVAPPQEALEAPPLRVQVTSGRRTVEQVIRGEALIGRPDTTRGIHPEIDLRQDDAVSRRHAKIFVKNGVYVLTDLNSTNGTRYNREWLQPELEVVLKAGDEVEVGESTRIKVLEAPQTHA